MNDLVKGGLVAGGTVGAVLLGQWAYKEYFQTGSNNSVLTQAVGSASHALDNSPNRTPFVRVGFPVFENSLISDGPVSNSNMNGLYAIAQGVFGDDNSAAIAMGLASTECMSGDLIVDCGNCSLFNIHWTPNNPNLRFGDIGLPYFWKGRDKLISFLTGADSQNQGFARSVIHLKGYLERMAPNALICMRNRDWNGFHLEMARIPYNSTFQRTSSGNTVTDSFVRRRYVRLIEAGRLNASPA
jgi:hypothetical protein